MTGSNRSEVRVTRAFSEDLERVLASLPRTSERTKDWMRAYFVDGQTTVEIGRAYGVAPQHVGNKVRAIRAKLSEQPSAMSYVQVTLALPMALGLELQELANELGALGSRDVAELTWELVLRAVGAARKKLREGD